MYSPSGHHLAEEGRAVLWRARRWWKDYPHPHNQSIQFFQHPHQVVSHFQSTLAITFTVPYKFTLTNHKSSRQNKCPREVQLPALLSFNLCLMLSSVAWLDLRRKTHNKTFFWSCRLTHIASSFLPTITTSSWMPPATQAQKLSSASIAPEIDSILVLQFFVYAQN
jgi:hypothetical protein